MKPQFKPFESSVSSGFLAFTQSNIAPQDWLALKPAVGGLMGIVLGLLIGTAIGWC